MLVFLPFVLSRSLDARSEEYPSPPSEQALPPPLPKGRVGVYIPFVDIYNRVCYN
jgi:hypothetical protein